MSDQPAQGPRDAVPPTRGRRAVSDWLYPLAVILLTACAAKMAIVVAQEWAEHESGPDGGAGWREAAR